LSFEVREVDSWSPGPPRQIVLFVQNDSTYSCMNFQIESSLVVQDDVIRDEMSGAIKAPEGICLTAIGPAVFRAGLGIGEGSYTLEFVRHGVTDRYGLTVTRSAIRIMTLQAHFTQPTARTSPRLP
jgi:hypothetical protein